MKKIASLLITLSLVFCMLIALPLTANAASVESQDGLVATILTDKDSYSETEEILLSIAIENNNPYEVTGISVETFLPEGLNIKVGELNYDNISIPAGTTYQTTVATVGPNGDATPPEETSKPEDTSSDTSSTKPEDTSSKTETSSEKNTSSKDTSSKKQTSSDKRGTFRPSINKGKVPQTGDNSIVALWIALLVVSAISIVLIIKFKKFTKLLSTLLCVALVLTVVPLGILTATNTTDSFSVDKIITVGDESYTLKATVSYPKSAIREFFSVAFESNGGNPIQAQEILRGDYAIQPANPVRLGYNFLGWYVDNETFTTSFDFSIPVNCDITLYAKWELADPDIITGSDDAVNVYSIDSLSVDKDSNSITAVVNAPENCALVVRFIEEAVYFSDNSPAPTQMQYINNGEMFASHVVAAGSNMAELTAVVSQLLPERFVAEAVLIDADGNNLCSPYSSIEHTERYQTFDSRTVYDFTEDTLVLNFDQSLNNNFGVLADDVKVLTAEDIVAEDVDNDGDNDQYKISNPSDTINQNDKIFMSDDDSDHLFKVLTVEIFEGYLIVVPAEANDQDYGFAMEDFYKFLKVDMEYDNDDTDNDNNINIQPISTFNASRGINVKNVYENISGETSLTFNPLTFETEHFKASAEISGKLSASLVFEWDIILFGEDYMRCDFTYSTDTTTTIEVIGKWDNSDNNNQLLEAEKEIKELNLGKLRIPFGVTGIDAFADIKVCVEWELTAGLKAEAVSKTTSGFKYNTVDGFQKVDEKQNDWTVHCEGHAEVKFGPKPSIGVEFLDGVLSAEVECFFGAVASADAVVPIDDGGDSKHACNLCVEGHLNTCITVDVKLEYKITSFLKGTPFDWNIVNIERHLFDFYISLLNDADSMFGGHLHAGTGSCPNRYHKAIVSVKNESGESRPGVVEIYKAQNNEHVGTAVSESYIYLAPGDYVAKTVIEGISYEKAFTITDGVKDVIINTTDLESTVSGSVIDITTGEVIEGATVSIYEYSTLVASGVTNYNGTYNFQLDQGDYMLEVSKPGYITATQYFSLRNGENKYLEATKLAEQDSSNIMGGIYGAIKNGVTGENVSGVNIRITKGWGNEGGMGEPVAMQLTDEYGEYSCRKHSVLGVDFGLDAGNYTITISKEGFITTSFNITIVGGEDMEFNSSITPVGGDGVYRIVLTWGEEPNDLDSHLNATYNGEREHVYYSDTQGNCSYLDVDDTSSYGPETITIEDINMYTGNIMYSIHDYTNKHSEHSTSLSMSSATVKVYCGAELIETFHVPTGNVGTVWDVFYFDSNHNVRPVNEFDLIDDPHYVYGSSTSHNGY